MNRLKAVFIVVALHLLLPSAPGAGRPTLKDKTLVAWVVLSNLTQRGGSVISLDNQSGAFDGIVFGEITPGKWMAGSDYFRRTQKEQAAWPMETAKPDSLIQIAAVYRDREVTLFRNGELYARHTIEAPQVFGPETAAILGLRHLDAGDRACFVGGIEDARIYDRPLDPPMLRALQPNRRSDPEPVAWWSFEGGTLKDRQGTFPPGRLVGNARVEHGRLILPGRESYFVSGAQPTRTRTRSEESWPIWHVSALPDEGVCLPYDANGCIWRNGRYHLMYIFQDQKRPHGGHCWGHASSSDLVNWTFHPASVVPAPGDPDVGIFSGNAFLNKEGKPMLCWFGINAGVCVATAEDDALIRWRKHPQNPIIPMPKKGEPGHGVYTVWDPYLWLEGDTYYCLLGGNKLPNGKDTLYVCRSTNLVDWTPLHPFYEHPDLSWTTEGEDCSCPDFFRLGNKHALLCISHKVGARLYLGRFDESNARFFPEQHIRMNWPGGTFFAPESLLDAKGRRIFWAWVTDPRSLATQRGTGSGVQSMPRVLSLGRDGHIRITPPVELEQLRRREQTIAPATISADSDLPLRGARGDSLELAVELDPGQARQVGLKIRCSPDGLEETGVWYDVAAKKLFIDMARSTRRTDVKYSDGPLDGYGSRQTLRNVVEAPFELAPGETLKLRVFLDKPMLEVFANERQCVTQQVFPANPRALLVKAAARGGNARLLQGQAWELMAAKFIDQRRASSP